MSNRNTSKIGSIALVLALVVSTVGLAFGAGGAAAQTDSTVLVDSSFEPTNTTDSAYVDIKGVDSMNGSGPVAVSVTFTGYNDGQDVANGTVLKTEEVSVAEGNVTSSTYSVSESDVTGYDNIAVDVSVVTAGEESLIDYADWGTLDQNAGGGGGFLSGASGLSLPVLAALGAGVLLLMGRGED